MTYKTAAQLIQDAKAQIDEIDVAALREARAADAPMTLIDVREQSEWNLGHIPGAMHIGRGVLESQIEPRVARETRIVVYCQSGNRSALAARTLGEMGYQHVASLAGGWRDWVAAGGEVED
jgi:rhodanese-related sulfurtransferase